MQVVSSRPSLLKCRIVLGLSQQTSSGFSGRGITKSSKTHKRAKRPFRPSGSSKSYCVDRQICKHCHGRLRLIRTSRYRRGTDAVTSCSIVPCKHTTAALYSSRRGCSALLRRSCAIICWASRYLSIAGLSITCFLEILKEPAGEARRTKNVANGTLCLPYPVNRAPSHLILYLWILRDTLVDDNLRP